jgi:hypothetical protein
MLRSLAGDVFDPVSDCSPLNAGEYLRDEVLLIHRPHQILDVMLKNS